MNVVYQALAESFDHGIIALRLEYRPSGSGPFDWAGMGVGVPISDDSLLWTVKWQPCLLNGDYDLRMVASDTLGDDPDVQPILRVRIDNCTVTPIEQPENTASVWFEDRAFADMGNVHAEVATPFIHTMVAVYEDQSGALATERISLYQPDPDELSWFSGSFDPSPIHRGGIGRFWIACSDDGQRTTQLTFGQLTVGCAAPDLNSEVTNEQICASVRIDAGMLGDSTYITLYPSRIPYANHDTPIGIWPNCAVGELVTAIRLKGPQWSTNGSHAQVQISYRTSVSDECLTIERLYPPPDGWILDPPFPGVWNDSVAGGIAVFQTSIDKLEGMYAAVTDSHSCEQRVPLPTSFFLAQNYPNPFNATTVLEFGAQSQSEWALTIYNVMGEVIRAYDGANVSGAIRIEWDGKDADGQLVPSGVYFYRLTTPTWSETKKMTLLK